MDSLIRPNRRALLVAGLGAAACGLAGRVGAAPTKRFRVAITTAGDALHWYPCYVARAANLFADEGLDIEWIDVGSGTKQVASVMGGSALATPLGLQTAIAASAGGADWSACPPCSIASRCSSSSTMPRSQKAARSPACRSTNVFVG